MAKSKASDPDSQDKLRQRAEREAVSRSEKRPKQLTLDQATRLLHELEVHQIELEMQNEELRLSRLEIELLRNKFQDMYDYAPVGYIGFDISGEIKEINLAAAQLLERPRQELLNRSFLPFVALDQRDNFRTFCRVSFQSQVREVCELRLGLFPDPVINVEFVGRACALGAGSTEKLLRAALFDVTQRDRLIRERERLIQEARAAQEEAYAANRAKDEFLAVLSHELRTPLTPMLGWIQVMQSRNCDPDVTSKGLEVIERNLKSQTRLIEYMHDVSRIIAGKFFLNSTRTELRKIAEQAADAVRSLAENKKITLELKADGDEFPVLGDRVRLYQLIGILLDNALKFTPFEGTILVELARSKESVVLKVCDTGVGISGAVMPFIFDRFTQTDPAFSRQFKGLGLGLSIARHLVEAHGGSIEAASPGLNQGTVMTVTLPLSNHVPDKAAEDPKASGKSKASTLRGTHILVVEDERDTRELLALGLERYGATVSKAECVPDALREFEQEVPDLILADIGLPGQDGYDLLQAIRSRPNGKKVPAIALTAYSEEEDRRRAFECGFQSHFVKPLDFSTLTDAICSAINGHN